MMVFIQLPFARLALAFLMLLWVSVSQANTAWTHEDLLKLQTATTNFYADVQRSDWEPATRELERIGKTAGRVAFTLDAQDERLVKSLIRSARAVHNRDQPASLHAANKMLEWIACAIHPRAPSDLPHLEYLVRETQIESNSNDSTKFAARVAEARRSWDRLRPTLEKTGDPAILREGDAALGSLALANTIEARTQAQTACLSLVERLDATVAASPP